MQQAGIRGPAHNPLFLRSLYHIRSLKHSFFFSGGLSEQTGMYPYINVYDVIHNLRYYKRLRMMIFL